MFEYSKHLVNSILQLHEKKDRTRSPLSVHSSSLSSHVQIISHFQKLVLPSEEKAAVPKKIIKTYQMNITRSDVIFLVILSTHGIPSL